MSCVASVTRWVAAIISASPAPCRKGVSCRVPPKAAYAETLASEVKSLAAHRAAESCRSTFRFWGRVRLTMRAVGRLGFLVGVPLSASRLSFGRDRPKLAVRDEAWCGRRMLG